MDMLATGDWRSIAALWAQCRNVGIVQLSGPNAALWATITATAYDANTTTSNITMSHAGEHDFQMRPHLAAPSLWSDEARAREDSVACEWYCIALD